MSKPTSDTKWASAATKIEPSSTSKNNGFIVGTKPYAQWENWWKDAVDQWVKWLQAFESTAHTWTALQSFGSVAVGGDDGSHANLGSLSVDAKPAIYGAASTNAASVGVYGVGASGLFFGTSGVAGAGGGSTGTAGGGGLFSGGATAGSAGVGGVGVSAAGGAADGTTNTTGSAGHGAVFTGGAVTSDANHRVGGDGVRSTAGLGQAGYGHAFHGIQGDLRLDNGGIDVTGGAAIVGAINALSAVNVYGLLTASGGLAVPGTVGFSFLNSWTNNGSGYSPASYSQEPTGRVYLQGSVKNTSSSTSPIAQLPATGPGGLGMRPTAKRRFQTDYGAFIEIDSSGNINPIGYSSGNIMSLDGVSFIP